ncbi:MAG: hypothetical protein ACTSQY_08265, partial [Candidatus Odinarchaeia archaeon]
MAEIISKRNWNSKTFKRTSPGLTTEFHIKQIHYLADLESDWRDIDMRVEEKSGIWQMDKSVFSCVFPKNSDEVLQFSANSKFKISTPDKERLRESSKTIINE